MRKLLALHSFCRRLYIRVKMLWMCTITSRLHGQASSQPVFVLSYQRTGSTLLLSYLASHPQITEYSEILNPDCNYGLSRHVKNTDAILQHISRMVRAKESKICCMKLMETQLAQRELLLNELIDRLNATYPQCRYILLYRESLIKQFISMMIARKTRQWHCRDDKRKKHAHVRLDVQELESFCNERKKSYRELAEVTSCCTSLLTLSYEQMVDNPQKVFDETVFPFLGVPRSEIQTPLLKQNLDDSIKDTVLNYDEIQHLFDDDRYTIIL